MAEEQWIDLNVTPKERIAEFAPDNIRIEDHGHMNIVEETDDYWIVMCHVCGEERKFYKDSSNSERSMKRIRQGRAKIVGNVLVLGNHHWYSPGATKLGLRITGVRIA